MPNQPNDPPHHTKFDVPMNLVSLPRTQKSYTEVLQLLDSRYRMSYGGTRVMWVIAMFDLPTESPELRKKYARFRKFLLNDGFIMLQYSVYGRCCPNRENATIHMDRIEEKVPDKGQVRVFALTELQMHRMKVFCGKIENPGEKSHDQLAFW
jgi:CRISPR-associated protein Cas2